LLQKAIELYEKEIALCDTRDLECSAVKDMLMLLVNYKSLQKCLDQQSNVFAATVWSFRQTFVGDHQTVFDTLAEVWRNGFYYFQSP